MKGLAVGLLGLFSGILIIASIIGGFAAANNDYYHPGIYRETLGAVWVELFLIRSILLGYVGAKGLRFAVRLGRESK